MAAVSKQRGRPIITGTITRATSRSDGSGQASVEIEWDGDTGTNTWAAILGDFGVRHAYELVGAWVEAVPEDQFVKPMSTPFCLARLARRLP